MIEINTETGFYSSIRKRFPILSDEDARQAWTDAAQGLLTPIGEPDAEEIARRILNSPEGAQIASRIMWRKGIGEQTAEVFMRLVCGQAGFAAQVQEHIAAVMGRKQ